MAAGHDRHHRMVEEGLFTLTDAFNVVVQTPARVCVCTAEAKGMKILRTDYFDQPEFAGRMKMYGAPADDTERWIAQKVKEGKKWEVM